MFTNNFAIRENTTIEGVDVEKSAPRAGTKCAVCRAPIVGNKYHRTRTASAAVAYVCPACASFAGNVPQANATLARGTKATEGAWLCMVVLYITAAGIDTARVAAETEGKIYCVDDNFYAVALPAVANLHGIKERLNVPQGFENGVVTSVSTCFAPYNGIENRPVFSDNTRFLCDNTAALAAVEVAQGLPAADLELDGLTWQGFAYTDATSAAWNVQLERVLSGLIYDLTVDAIAPQRALKQAKRAIEKHIDGAATYQRAERNK